MFRDKEIAFFEVGQEIEGFYLLKDLTQRLTTTNRPFLTLVLEDVTGSVEGKVWDYSGPIGKDDVGKIVKIHGDVSEFKGSIQVTVTRIRLAKPDDPYDLAKIVPSAPVRSEDNLKYVRETVASVEDEDLRRLGMELLTRHEARFSTIPAAKSVHHSFLGGLLMHTANMLRSAAFFADLYPRVVDRSLLIVGTLLHDFAKEEEFLFSDTGMVREYSVKGQLLGHLVMGAREVAETAKELGVPEEKSVLLQHLILSHHGEPEHGAAVRPVCAEAELLSYIDLVDSRMEIYAEAFDEVPVGEFSDRIFSLDKKIYHHKDLSQAPKEEKQ